MAWFAAAGPPCNGRWRGFLSCQRRAGGGVYSCMTTANMQNANTAPRASPTLWRDAQRRAFSPLSLFVRDSPRVPGLYCAAPSA